MVDYILLALATFAGLAAAAGGVMLTTPRPNQLAARLAFWAAAVCFSILGVLWGVGHNEQSMPIRLAVAGVTAAVA